MTWCLCGYGAIQRTSPIKLDASHPTASGQRLVRCCDGFPPFSSSRPSASQRYCLDWDPDGQRELRTRLRRRDRFLSPWRLFTLGPLVQKAPKKNTESQYEPLWELGCRLTIHVRCQLPSCYYKSVCTVLYARRMRTVHHAGIPRQLIPTYR